MEFRYEFGEWEGRKGVSGPGLPGSEGKLPALGNGTVRGCGKGVFGLFSILAT